MGAVAAIRLLLSAPVIEDRRGCALALNAQRYPAGLGCLGVYGPRVGEHLRPSTFSVEVRGFVGLIPRTPQGHRAGARQVEVEPASALAIPDIWFKPLQRLVGRDEGGRGHPTAPESGVNDALRVLKLRLEQPHVSHGVRVSPWDEGHR